MYLSVSKNKPCPVLTRELDRLTGDAALNRSEPDFVDGGIVIRAQWGRDPPSR